MITPRILQGTRDFLPADMAKRDFVMNKIKSIFIRFGYDTIETPVIEYAETLLGKYGEEGSKLLYRFKDNGDRDIALRYDQTVPFARLVAANYQTLPMPFKRYQISRVWRADRPAKGRYREFYQCDVDIIGTQNLLAEAEIAKVVYTVFRELGFPNFVIKINSRRLLNSILTSLDISADQQPAIIRSIDKLEKIGQEGVMKELGNGPVRAENLPPLFQILSITGTNAQKIAALQNYDTSEIQTFLNLCNDFGIDEKNLQFDLSLARGLDYYTGISYEVVCPEVAIGSLCGGGRYDDLCSLFCDQKFSGVGVAFGFDRTVLAMEELGLLKDISLNSQVLVAYFDETTLSNSLKILTDLQQAGINAEIYFEPEKMGKQFKFADKKQIPFVALCGPDEMKAGTVTLKSMQSGKQKTIPQNQIVEYLKGYN